jgi:hypothetical protein
MGMNEKKEGRTVYNLEHDWSSFRGREVSRRHLGFWLGIDDFGFLLTQRKSSLWVLDKLSLRYI